MWGFASEINKSQILVLLCAITFLSGCSGIRLSLIPESNVNIKSTGYFCTQPPEEKLRYTKFLFVMDKSGSNVGTDPGAEKRATNIEKFYNDNKNEPFYEWGMIQFRDPGTKALIGGENDPIFTAEEGLVYDAIDKLRESDNGGTPYGAALSLSKKAILNDIEAYPKQDNVYMIFFVSDGSPTDYGNNNDDSLFRDTQDLVDLVDNRVFISTAYYGGNGGGAEARLKRMAEIGGGKYVNFNNTDELDFSKLVTGPTAEPYQIRQELLLTYNLNASICFDGGVDVDSDGDGLCDKDEAIYGFDPTKRFSMPSKRPEFADKEENWFGYGDYFRWRSINYKEALLSCDDLPDPRSDYDHDHLTQCEERYVYNRNPSGSDGRSPDEYNPDSDRDGILDGLEIFVFKDKSSPVDDTNMDRNFDGEGDALSQIKEHRNPKYYDPNAFRYNLTIQPDPYSVVTNQGNLCYFYEQSQLLVYRTLPVGEEDNFPSMVHDAGENVTLVYYVQVFQNNPNGDGILNYSLQKLKATQLESDVFGVSRGLIINDRIFSQYERPKGK